MRKSFLLLGLLCISATAFAQRVKGFPHEPEAWLKAVNEVVREQDKDKAEALMLDFTPLWTGGELDAQRPALYELGDIFYKKRVTAAEDWEYFLRTVQHLHGSEESGVLDTWLNGLLAYAKKSSSRLISDFLRTSYYNFYQAVLYEDRSIRWRFEGGDALFTYEEEPHLELTEVDIWGYFNRDSTFIEKASGTFYPESGMFNGRGGKVYWTRGGIGPDSLHAELSTYRINMRKSGYEADSVTLYSAFYLKEPTVGRLEEKLTSQTEPEVATFPRFESYNNNISIPEFVPGVDYIGGFSAIGSKFYGSGSAESPATLLFKYENAPLIRARADRFRLRKGKFSADATQVRLYLKNDSVVHPKLTLRYLPETQRLSLLRDKEGISLAPFQNSYHNLAMYFEQLNWKLGDPSMEISNLNLGAASPAIFESENYYRGERFDQLTGLNDKNPLFYLRQVTEYYGTRTLTLEQIAPELRMSERDCERFLMLMMIEGFVDYDMNKRTVTVRDKTYDYLNNFAKKRDYDVIRFVSGLTSGANAKLSLLNYDMEVSGIRAIALSDSQKVALFPTEGKIIIQENLDFKFDGAITAGRFTFWGQNYLFSYDQFKIGMENIDSMKFKVESFKADALGNRPLVDVKNTLQDINGTLFIDKPNNKSGKESFSEYPIFRSDKEAYVYYDRPSLFDRVYDRTRFYVELEPFEIDSLDNTSTSGLKFEGTFVSAGIFPEMEQTIGVQQDYSLGFEDVTPPDGLPAYGGKGTFTNKISLSNRGLRGEGTLDYLTSTSVSPDWIFFPDSTSGVASTYEVRPQIAAVEYPHATGSGSQVRWHPYQDVMYSTSRETPFAMYDDVGMVARGTLEQRPGGMSGKGQLDFLNAQTNSLNYHFKNRQFSSQDLAFKVKANPEADWGFQLDDARGEVNFQTQKGEFTLNDPARYLSFPVNKYIAYMDHADWFIPQKSIEVKKLGQEPASRMVSTNRVQDSLQYLAGSARFYLEPSILEGFQVNEIEVADARIYPDSAHVVVDPGGKMRTLQKARALATRSNEYHNFYNATLNIVSRNSYRGQALYDYLDKDGTPWTLAFDPIRVDTSGQTVAQANVSEEDGFYLSPFFAYQGKVFLEAREKNLLFKGKTLIQHTCENVTTTWFPFESRIDPAMIVIDLPIFGEDRAAERLYNGIFIANDSTSGYSAFLSRASSRADLELIRADGKLYYDELLSSYVICRQEKIDDIDAPGQWLAFNNRDCATQGKGRLGFGDKTGQIKLDALGVIDHDLISDGLQIDLFLGFDFFFNQEVLEQMAASINAEANAPAVDLGREAYQLSVRELLPDKEANKFFEELSLLGAPEKLPREMQNTVVFNDLKLVWHPETNSFLSEGPVGVGSIGKTQINKKLVGHVEIVRKRRGDEIYIYLEVDNSTFFYFEYKRNMMQFYCGDDALMDLIKAEDIDKRRKEQKGGGVPYTYTISTKAKMNRFLNRLEDY